MTRRRSRARPGLRSRRSVRRILHAVLLVLLGIAVVAGALAGVRSAAGPGTADPAGQARAIGVQLRCPTCLGETVADSSSPIAAAMRAAIRDRLDAGDEPAEVLAWFAERYGPDVLLDPQPSGAGLLFLVLPLLLVVGACAIALMGGRWARTTADGAGRVRRTAIVLGAAVGTGFLALAAWGPLAESRMPGGGPGAGGEDAAVAAAEPEGRLAALQDAVAADPGDADLRVAFARALDAAGRPEEAVEQYDALVRLRPGDPGAGYAAADAAVRAGRGTEALARLDAVLALEPAHAPSLLLRGSILWAAGLPEARADLERFLELAPEAPVAADVRTLLEGEPGRSR
jgi:cytochrome c-type biogenesis protein CcmH/NrfF